MRLVVVFVLLALLVTWTVVAETSRREADLLNARTELLHTGAAAMLEGFVSRGRVLQSVLLRDDRTLDLVSRLTASDAGARDEATRTLHALLESRQTALQGQGYGGLSLRDARGGLLLPLGSPVDQRPLGLPVLRALESRGQVWGFEAGDRFALFRMIHVLEDEGERVGYLDTSLSRAVVLKSLALSLPGVALDLVLNGSAVGAAVPPGSPGVAPSSLGPSFVRELPPPGGGGLDDGHFGLRDPGGLVEEALARAPREALSAGLARGQAFALFVDGGPDVTGVIALLPLFDLEGTPIGLMTGFWPGTERAALWTQAVLVLAIGLGLIVVLGGWPWFCVRPGFAPSGNVGAW
ncbi:hypothetical protein [Pararhodospirillum photometricum]|uniref:Double Cache domain-containing protein n=1 Tax=Pararhodospirillum photometricum DSM 122 TaxID=1150469 RepID=H6SQW6_PARPM|nr:hypothetical protein [Pararhodospirillum photometricum]CCG07431.1 unnamed protein product [Pararhodospirillum photometricum DSM 122]